MRFDIVLDIVNDTVNNRLALFAEQGNKDKLTALVTFIKQSKHNLRYHAIATDADIAIIWDGIRSDEIITDFVMGGVSEVRLRVCGFDDIGDRKTMEQRWQNIVDGMAVSLGGIRDAEFSHMDMDYRQRGYNTKQWTDLFQKNPWLVFMYLLELTNLRVTLQNNAPREGTAIPPTRK